MDDYLLQRVADWPAQPVTIVHRPVPLYHIRISGVVTLSTAVTSGDGGGKHFVQFGS